MARDRRISSRISPMKSFRYDSSVIAVTVKYRPAKTVRKPVTRSSSSVMTICRPQRSKVASTFGAASEQDEQGQRPHEEAHHLLELPDGATARPASHRHHPVAGPEEDDHE